MASVTGTSGSGGVSMTMPTMTDLSPDAMIAFCQVQLSDLDQQISDDMKWQNTQVADRKLIAQVQDTLQSFGTQGPQSGTDMQKCIDGFTTAIDAMDPSDPNRVTLQAQLDAMKSAFPYTPAILGTEKAPMLPSSIAKVSPLAAWSGSGASAGTTSETTPVMLPEQFTKPVDLQWKGTTDSLNTVVDNIKSGAEIQLLQLQDLIAQRQRAVETATGMMTKTDQTLEDQARAIGQ
jgi:hypothetical protein